MQVYLSDRSAETMVHAATLRDAGLQTCYLTQSQDADTGPTSPTTDPSMPGAWQSGQYSSSFEVPGMTTEVEQDHLSITLQVYTCPWYDYRGRAGSPVYHTPGVHLSLV